MPGRSRWMNEPWTRNAHSLKIDSTDELADGGVVARPEHCHDSQVHDGGASRCCWRVETETCSMFSTLSPSLADLRPLLSRLQSRGSIQLPNREFADPRVGLDCVTAIGVLETDLKSSSGAVILATGWACSSPQLICCGADGDVWQTTDTRPPGAVLEVVKRDRGSRSWCAMLPCG